MVQSILGLVHNKEDEMEFAHNIASPSHKLLGWEGHFEFLCKVESQAKS